MEDGKVERIKKRNKYRERIKGLGHVLKDPFSWSSGIPYCELCGAKFGETHGGMLVMLHPSSSPAIWEQVMSCSEVCIKDII